MWEIHDKKLVAWRNWVWGPDLTVFRYALSFVLKELEYWNMVMLRVSYTASGVEPGSDKFKASTLLTACSHCGPKVVDFAVQKYVALRTNNEIVLIVYIP